jgi:hypothetical protein
MDENVEIKIIDSVSLKRHYLTTKFHENLPSHLKDIHPEFILKKPSTHLGWLCPTVNK